MKREIKIIIALVCVLVLAFSYIGYNSYNNFIEKRYEEVFYNGANFILSDIAYTLINCDNTYPIQLNENITMNLVPVECLNLESRE